MSKGSVSFFHCNQDGATVYTKVVSGKKMAFFLIDPTAEDYTSLQQFSEFFPSAMEGRIVCVVVQEGDLLIYPSGLPHGFIAVDDTVTFGGRVLVPSAIPDFIEFIEDPKSKFCLGLGYTQKQMKFILMSTLGRTFQIILDQHFSRVETREGHKHVLTQLDHYLERNGSANGISKEDLRQMKSLTSILSCNVVDELKQHKTGVFYLTEDSDVQERLKQSFVDGSFISSCFNVVGGSTDGIIYPPKQTDMDYCPKAMIDRFRVNGSSYDPSTFYIHHLGFKPKVLLKIRGNRLGLYAYNAIKTGEDVSEFTGLVRTSDFLCTTQQSDLPAGRCYFLRWVSRAHLNQPPMRIIVDANKFGGASLFYRISDTPNSMIEAAEVGGRYTLVVKATIDIKPGEEVTIPQPLCPDVEANALYDDIWNSVGSRELAYEVVTRPSRFFDDCNVYPPNTPSSASHIEEQHQEGNDYQFDRLDQDTDRLDQGTDRPDQDQISVSTELGESDERLDDPNKETGTPKKPKGGKATTVSRFGKEPITFPRLLPPKARKHLSKSTSKTDKGVEEEPQSKANSSGGKKPVTPVRRSSRAKSIPPVPQQSPAGKGDKPNKPPRGSSGPKPKVPTDSSSSSSSDSDDNEEESQRPFRDHTLETSSRIRRAQIGFYSERFPNDQNKEAYDALNSRQKALVAAQRPELVFPEFRQYRRTNRELRGLYGMEARRRACAICAHYGKVIPNHRGVGFKEMGDKRGFINHWWNQHHERINCPICDLRCDNFNILQSHAREMRKNPHPPHKKGDPGVEHLRPERLPAGALGLDTDTSESEGEDEILEEQEEQEEEEEQRSTSQNPPKRRRKN